MTSRNDAPELITLDQRLAHQFAPREDLIAPWFRQGESVMVWAKPGVGKSMLTLTMALMIAGGGSALGWQSPKPRKVLLVDGEMNAEDLKQRADYLMEAISGLNTAAAGQNLKIMARTWQQDAVHFPDLNDREGAAGRRAGQDVIFDAAKDHEAELVLLDNYSTLAEVGDENSAGEMGPMLAFLMRLKAARIGCVLVHHSDKSGAGARGSSKLETTFEVILGLLPMSDARAGSTGTAFEFKWTKWRRAPNAAVHSQDVTLCNDEDGNPVWRFVPSVRDKLRALVEAVRSCEFESQAQLAAHLGISPGEASKRKVAAFHEGLITEAEMKQCMAEAQRNRDGKGGEDAGEF